MVILTIDTKVMDYFQLTTELIYNDRLRSARHRAMAFDWFHHRCFFSIVNPLFRWIVLAVGYNRFCSLGPGLKL